MTTILLTLFLVAFAIVLLGVKVLFVKNGKFPTGHVHDIPALRKQNIKCGTKQ